MTDATLNDGDVRRSISEAIDRVGDRTHSREHVEILAAFAESVLRNVSEKALKPAWDNTKRPSPSEVKEWAASRAAMVFKTCNNQERPLFESLELAYWAYHAESETQGHKRAKSVAALGPSPLRIERTLKLWRKGRRQVAAPLATLEVDYERVQSPVIPALNEYGFGIPISAADWFKKTEINRRKNNATALPSH